MGLSDFAKLAPWRPPSLLLETDAPIHDVPRSIMNKIVSLSTFAAKRRFDAVTELAEVLPLRVFPDAIGIRQVGREQLLAYAAATFNAFGSRNEMFHATNETAKNAVSWVSESCRRMHLDPEGWGMAVHEAATRGELSMAI